MKIYLVRHGETDWNKARRLQGQSDVPLNEYGRELARLTAKGLENVPFDAAFASPLNRAVETATIILNDRPVPIGTDERLMEMSFGVEEGADIPAIKANPKNPLYNFLNKPEAFVPPAEGEDFPAIYKRSNDFMKNCILPIEKQYENILIVAHGALNRSIMNPIMNIPIENFWQLGLHNCSVSIIKCEHGKLEVLDESILYYDR